MLKMPLNRNSNPGNHIIPAIQSVDRQSTCCRRPHKTDWCGLCAVLF